MTKAVLKDASYTIPMPAETLWKIKKYGYGSGTSLMLLLQSLIPRACKQGIKSKAGAIKCFKEIKITAPPNEWGNIPFMEVIVSIFEVISNHWKRNLKKIFSVLISILCGLYVGFFVSVYLSIYHSCVWKF